MLLPWTAASPPRPATLLGFISWGDDDPQLVQHRFSAQRLLRQAPAITEIVQLDENGNERLREWKVTPIYAFRQANHSMNGLRRDQGVSVVKLSVILVWEVVRQVKAGEHVTPYVLDTEGRVIAQSDDLNLFQHDFSSLPQVQAASVTGVVTRDISGCEVLIAYAAVAAPA